MVKTLTPKEFAEILSVSEDQARAIMHDLPNVDCSRRANGKYKTLRISVAVAEAFVNGEIKRQPQVKGISLAEARKERNRQLAAKGRKASEPYRPIPYK